MKVEENGFVVCNSVIDHSWDLFPPKERVLLVGCQQVIKHSFFFFHSPEQDIIKCFC